MKVSFLAPHLRISGGTRILLTYASRLAGRGHDVTVYVRSANAFRRTVANLFGLKRPQWIPGFAARVERISAFEAARVSDADTVIATNVESMLAIDGFPVSKGRKYFLLQHDEGLYHAPREAADRSYRTDAKKIAVSNWIKDVVKERSGQDADLLINPIDHEQFKKLPRTSYSGEVRVLLLHHTYPWKGTAEGAATILEVKRRHPEVRLIGFGVRDRNTSDIAYDEYYDNVPQNELATLYSNTDIYLCPSWDEGFGLPSVEAMACGAALVTYDNGGSRDYAFHERTALVARHRDAADLERQLERLVSDAALRERIAMEGKRFVDALPSWNERTEEFEDILKR